jgi:hypothetical protein
MSNLTPEMVEAAAKWLRDDDSAYTDEPDIARRAARAMIEAALAIAQPSDSRAKDRSEIARLKRIIKWCRPRLSHALYRLRVDDYLAGEDVKSSDTSSQIVQSATPNLTPQMANAETLIELLCGALGPFSNAVNSQVLGDALSFNDLSIPLTLTRGFTTTTIACGAFVDARDALTAARAFQARRNG